MSKTVLLSGCLLALMHIPAARALAQGKVAVGLDLSLTLLLPFVYVGGVSGVFLVCMWLYGAASSTPGSDDSGSAGNEKS